MPSIRPAHVVPAIRRRWVSARPRTLKAKRRVVAAGSLSAAQLELLRRTSSRISHRDGMYGGAGEHYYRVGISAVACIDEALGAAGATEPGAILDLPCGHGRVLRALAARFPAASLTASDVDRDGVAFCARAWGATPVVSSPHFDSLGLGGPFDLVWCGSLVTHLDADGIAALLRCFARHLTPGGVAVVTTHGEQAVRNMREGSLDYLLEHGVQRALVGGYERDGFGYSDYACAPGYGVSVTSPDWMSATVANAGLREVSFQPAGWDDHQDVFGLASA